jgi:hypothetical protein
MLAGQARLVAGSMQACHQAINDGEGLVQQWRVTQLTRLEIPGRWRRPRPITPAGIRATASPPAAQAGDHTIEVTPAHTASRQPGHGDHDLRRQSDRTAMEITMNRAGATNSPGGPKRP